MASHIDAPGNGLRNPIGTLQFMAIGLLRNPADTHTFKHDMESFFWLLVYLCMTYNPKGKLIGARERPRMFDTQVKNGDTKEVRNAKIAFIFDRSTFDRSLATHGDPAMVDLFGEIL